jgi:hypothetical protein
MDALVTGGTGFVGANVVRDCCAPGLSACSPGRRVTGGAGRSCRGDRGRRLLDRASCATPWPVSARSITWPLTTGSGLPTARDLRASVDGTGRAGVSAEARSSHRAHVQRALGIEKIRPAPGGAGGLADMVGVLKRSSFSPSSWRRLAAGRASGLVNPSAVDMDVDHATGQMVTDCRGRCSPWTPA